MLGFDCEKLGLNLGLTRGFFEGFLMLTNTESMRLTLIREGVGGSNPLAGPHHRHAQKSDAVNHLAQAQPI